MTPKAISFLSKLYRTPFDLHERIEAARKSSRCILAADAKFYPSSRVNNNRERDSIQIGERCRILGRLETLGHGGKIIVGRDCFVGENSRIWSSVSVTIGDRTLISHDVNIHDTDSHSLSAQHRHRHFTDIFAYSHPNELDGVKATEIVIGDDVWIGFSAAIFKGVTIGNGAVIGAHTVITKSVDSYVIMVGNPARKVGEAHP